MLEKKRIKAELARVRSAKAEMEYQIELKKEEIERLQSNLEKQEAAEIEIQAKLNLIEEKK